MNIDIICPLYNAEKDIENLHKSLLKQKNVQINEVKYVLTESKDDSEEKLRKLNINYKKIKKEEFSNNIYFEDYEIKFQVIDNNYRGKFPKNDLIKLFDYDKIKDS